MRYKVEGELKIKLQVGLTDVGVIYDNELFFNLMAKMYGLKTTVQAKDKMEKIININKLKNYIVLNKGIKSKELNKKFPHFTKNQCAYYIGIMKKNNFV